MKLKTLAIILLTLIYGFSSATANVTPTEEKSTLNYDKDEHDDEEHEPKLISNDHEDEEEDAGLISNDHDEEDEDSEEPELMGCDKDDHEDDEDKELIGCDKDDHEDDEELSA